jgi:WD40 repeat protein
MATPSTSPLDTGATRCTLEVPPTSVVESTNHRPSIPGYEILGELGRGGMGVVYKARQLRLDRLVALKMILNGEHAGAEALTRFRGEVEAIARLEHPNLVHVYEVGEHDGMPFFSMEFVSGGTLAARIARQAQPPRDAAQMVETLARAMHAVHLRGIVHRDLKPGNILLQKLATDEHKLTQIKERSSLSPICVHLRSSAANFIPKITDFGLAKRLDAAEGPTLSGRILGTPNYMAPEQALGERKRIGPSTDVYALGAILYEMLAGRPPFTGETAWDIIAMVVAEEPVTPRRLHPKVPRDLEIICLKCLHKDIGRRYSNAEALADDLRRFQNGEPIQARPTPTWERAWKWARRHPAVAALAAVVVTAVVALLAVGAIYHGRVVDALHQAEQYAEEGRQRLVRLHVAEGMHRLDQGDSYGALVWFTEALRLDEGRPECEDIHRMRIAAVLRQCPRLRDLWIHDGPVSHAVFGKRGINVATASEDHSARVWNVRTGSPACPPLMHSGAVVYVALSPDGKLVATACADGTARIWQVARGKAVGEPLYHRGPVACVAFSPDVKLVLSASEDGTVHLWDAATGQPHGTPFQLSSGVRHATFSPDGKHLVAGCADGTVSLWNVAGAACESAPMKHGKEITWTAFSPDGKRLATSSADGTARLWDARTGKSLAPPLKHRAPVVHVAFRPDSRRIVTASDDLTACIWDAQTGALVLRVHQGSGVNFTAYSPDGHWLATASDDNTARVWDAETGEPITPWLKAYGSMQVVLFSPDGNSVLTGSNDGIVRVWEVATPRPQVTSPTTVSSAPPAALGKWLSPDGRLVAVTEGPHSARVRDAATNEPVGPPLRHGSTILHAAFSGDGRLLITASDDNTARIWDLATGELRTQPLRHCGTVRTAAFSPDAHLVVTAGDDRTARVWDAVAGHPITPLLPLAGAVQSVTFSADGQQVYVKNEEGTTWTWPLERDDRPVAELVNLAQILDGSRIDSSRGVVALDIDQLRRGWERLRANK